MTSSDDIDDLRARLAEAEQALDAIRAGEVDSLVINTEAGLRVYAVEATSNTYRVLVEAMSEGAATLSAEGTILYSNGRLASMLDMPLERIIGRPIHELVRPRAHATLDGLLSAAQSTDARSELSMTNAAGEDVPAYLSLSAMADGGQAVLCLVVTDLRAQKRNEAMLAAERLARSLLEQAAEAVLVCDAKGYIVRASDSALQLCGSSPLFASLDQAFPLVPLERWWPSGTGIAAAALRGETLRAIPATLRVPGGRTAHVLVSAVPLHGAGSRVIGCLVTLVDVSEVRRAEAAEEATRAKDRFLAILSHELRAPLAPVLSAVQLLQRKPDLNEALRSLVEVIGRNVQLEARLIDDLLDLTRIVQGKLELECRPLDIASVIARAVEVVKPTTEARKIGLDVEIEGGPHWVNADASRLQQVLWNLLSNAVKFTPEHGSVSIRCRSEQARLLIEVVDDGMGIESAALGRIFDAFEQGGPVVTRRFGGLGLGLSIAKRLVGMHKGTISAHSEGLNKGSTFRVVLPLVETQSLAKAEERAVSPAGPSKRILLVEDDEDTAATTKMVLEDFGYEVETAGDVTQGLRAIDSQQFDLLISDLGLRDESGLDLIAEVRRRGNTIRGIALSGDGRQRDIRRSLEAGFDVHLTKPVDVDVLVAEIARLA